MRKVFVWALLFAMLLLGGCSAFSRLGGFVGGIFGGGHSNDYAEMHQRLDRDAVRYDAALHEIVDETNTRRAGIITEPDWRLFAAGVENVRTANEAVKKDMDEWGATGTRPAMLAPHVDALLAAQNSVIAIVRKVKP